MKRNKVSVIVPTYNGAGRISKVLDALRVQTFQDFELLVVIDGSVDNTHDVLKKYKGAFQQLRIFEQKNLGRAAVRNRGAREASGSILVFFDDDMLPEPDSVDKHVAFHKSYVNAICAGNQLDDPLLCVADFCRFRCWLSEKWIAKYKSDLNELSISDIFLTAANFSISLKLFNKLGGFDEQLRDAEDYDLARRAIEVGARVCFMKNNIAWHRDPMTCQKYITRGRQYHQAHRFLHSIRPHWSELAPKRYPYYKRWIFSFFANKSWVIWIDREWLKILPKRSRYLIYDYVVTALSNVFPEKKV